ncbi:MAG: GH3 auxin-responsive promoter family protein [Alphaproteobacteria bacterium]
MRDATPLLRLYGWRRRRALERQDPVATQERELLRLVRRAAGTRFGRDHDFPRIASVADFQARVPLRRYEDFWDQYWRRPFPRLDNVSWPGVVPYFAVTSGTTTGRTRYIPCTREMVRANQRAAADVLVHHLARRPRSHVFGGRNFVLGGSTALVEEAPGVRSGDVSGIAAAEVPRWAKSRYFPPPELALIADWEEKIARLGPLSLAEDIRSLSGTPSWLLVLLDALHALRPTSAGRLVDYFPRLELLVHGGVDFAPYRHRFAELLRGGHAELREVYPASEGFIAVADQGPVDGLRAILDNGLFLEFVPVEELDAAAPIRHWTATLEVGVNYAIALSSCAGAWAYLLGDTVRILSRDPTRLRITGRTAYMLSAFGEHLIGEEIETAVAEAASAIGGDVTDYAVGARYPARPGELGRHVFVVEFATPPPTEAVSRFARTIDRSLSATNDDYRAHRARGFGMAEPEVRPVPPGTFVQWMRARGQLGGQHKVPRVITEAELFAGLLRFIEERAA